MIALCQYAGQRLSGKFGTEQIPLLKIRPDRHHVGAFTAAEFMSDTVGRYGKYINGFIDIRFGIN